MVSEAYGHYPRSLAAAPSHYVLFAIMPLVLVEINSTTILYPLMATTNVFRDSKKAQIATGSTVDAVFRTAKVSVSRHYVKLEDGAHMYTYSPSRGNLLAVFFVAGSLLRAGRPVVAPPGRRMDGPAAPPTAIGGDETGSEQSRTRILEKLTIIIPKR